MQRVLVRRWVLCPRSHWSCCPNLGFDTDFIVAGWPWDGSWRIKISETETPWFTSKNDASFCRTSMALSFQLLFSLGIGLVLPWYVSIAWHQGTKSTTGSWRSARTPILSSSHQAMGQVKQVKISSNVVIPNARRKTKIDAVLRYWYLTNTLLQW